MDPTKEYTDTEVVPSGMEVSRSSAVDRAEIDSQIATAHQYPRNVAAAKRAMEGTATLDADTAASCFYTLPRAGKAITGPSIRMAEIALSTWGNLRASTKIVSVVATGPTPHVEVEAVVHDLETNVAYKVAKRRRITHKKSKTAPTRTTSTSPQTQPPRSFSVTPSSRSSLGPSCSRSWRRPGRWLPAM